MKTRKITHAESTTPPHGPDSVRVLCDGHELHVQVPRGTGDAYVKALGGTLTFARVQITERPDGTASVQLDTRRGDGTHVGSAAVDFDEEFADSAEARGYARAWGFAEATVIKPRPLMRRGLPAVDRSNKPRLLMLPATESL